MNLRRTADSLKALPLFGVLLVCGVDLEGPASPGFDEAARVAVMADCEPGVPCLPDELWDQALSMHRVE